MNWEKVTLRYRSSLHRYRSCKKEYDSREFQDLDSICGGKFSHVPTQPAVVPSPRMLSRDQSLRSGTCNLSGTQANFFGTPRAVIDSSQIPYQGILHSLNQSATGGNSVQKSTGKLVVKGEAQIGSTIPMPINHELSLTSRSTAENQWMISKDCKSRSFISMNSPTPSTFSRWRIRFETKAGAFSGFHPEALSWIKEVEMVDSVRWLKIIAINSGCCTLFSNFEMLHARIASALNKIMQNSYFEKKVSLDEQNALKEDRFLCGRQNILYHSSQRWCSGIRYEVWWFF